MNEAWSSLFTVGSDSDLSEGGMCEMGWDGMGWWMGGMDGMDVVWYGCGEVCMMCMM